jgi:hypothetical protein
MTIALVSLYAHSYSRTLIPAGATIYTFSPPHQLRDTVLLLPPADAINSRPLFHISASMSPFMPNAITTLLKTGDNADGEDVADFELVVFCFT